MEGAFIGAAINRIEIPQSVEVIGANCFQSCKSLEIIEFDNDSKLKHVDPSAFASSSVQAIIVPGRISSLFSCATPANCELQVRKIAQKRAFTLEDWRIDLSEYQRVMVLNQGTVRLLEHRTTNAQIVAKEFPFISGSEPESPPSILEDQRFKRELEALIALRHPSIVTMQGWSQFPDDENAQLIFEYLPPPCLKNVIARPANYEWWTSTAKAKAIVGLVQAMIFVHSRNLMHRELKTRIVFFDEEHQIKLGGFGRSKFDDSDSLQQTMFGKGTSLYQAPEMWEEEYNASVDVYAFAMILFRVATGHSPFPEMRRKQGMARMSRVMDGDRAKIDDNVAALTRDLIESCWDHNPSARPTFVQIMETLDRANFQLFPDVDSDEVRRYIELVRVKSQLL
jgi:serine/threonine protein kinase